MSANNSAAKALAQSMQATMQATSAKVLNDAWEKRLRELPVPDGFWRNKEGELVAISSMETSWIQNCINLLDREGRTDHPAMIHLTLEIAEREQEAKERLQANPRKILEDW